MKLRGVRRRGLACLLAVLGVSLATLAYARTELDWPEALDASVAVDGVTRGASGDLVTGRIDNHTAAELRDVRVLVTHEFLWTQERNPGDDSPGRTEVLVVDGPIPPHGSAVFRHEVVPPLPARPDGRYQTSAQIVGFTTVGPSIE